MLIRHILLVAAAALAVSACVDHGQCLASQTVHHQGYTYMQPMSFDGKNTMLMPIIVPDSDEVVCARWEFPNGRPKVAK